MYGNRGVKSGAADGGLGIGRRRRAGRAEGVFRWSFRSDFTNKMGESLEPAGPKATDILSCAF